MRTIILTSIIATVISLVFPSLAAAATLDTDLELNAPYDDSSYFGSPTMNVGDVSGDGIDDLMIGAAAFDAIGDENGGPGAVHVYYGQDGEELSASPDLTILGENGGDVFGSLVHSFPDVSGDGLPEVIVSAYYADTDADSRGDGSNRGKVYFFTSESLQETSEDNIFSLSALSDGYLMGYEDGDTFGIDIEVYEGESDAYLMVSASSAEDQKGVVYFFNKDTISDIINNETITLAKGSADFSVAGEEEMDFFGLNTLAWTEGGYVVMASTSYDNGSGRVYFMKESTVANYVANPVYEFPVVSLADAVITGAAESQYFGWVKADAGNGSIGSGRYLALSAPYYDSTNTNDGRVYIFTTALIETLEEGSGFGIAETDSIIDLLGAGGENDQFGIQMTGVGTDYFAIGERGYHTNVGEVYMFENSTLNALADDDDASSHGALTEADFIMNGVGEESHLGLNLAEFAEDLDQDGVNEIILGAPGNTQSGSETVGRAFVVNSGNWMGSADQVNYTAFTDPVYQMQGQQDGDGFGGILNGLGDYDGNGDIDLLVGALNFDDDRGKVHAFYNREDADGEYEYLFSIGKNKGKYQVDNVEEQAEGVSLSLSANISNQNNSVHTALGDVDGDGDVELLVTSAKESKCHTIEVRHYSSNKKEKSFKVCHPKEQATRAYISAGDYSGNGKAEIAIAMPDGATGTYVQIQKRKNNGKYKKLRRARLQTGIDFSGGVSISSGNLSETNKEQFVIASLTRKQQAFVYKLNNSSKFKQVKKKKVNTKKKGVYVAIDSSTNTLYTVQVGKKKVQAFSWTGSGLKKDSTKTFTAGFKPKGIAAAGDVVALVKKNQKSVRFYYQTNGIRNKSYSQKIWSIDIVDKY